MTQRSVFGRRMAGATGGRAGADAARVGQGLDGIFGSVIWRGKATDFRESVMQNPIAGQTAAYIQVFLYLQILDFLTTLVGLKLGMGEANPFIRSLLHFGPGIAVAASKMVAIALVGLCISLDRRHLLRWINYWFAALIIWNLCNILFL